jgi:prepilin-type N-terminal cleavage/methylation domain-containing protein
MRSGRGRFQSDAGVSLIEVLTAMFIIALMAAAVVIAAPGPDRQTRAFVTQFAGRVALASEESIISNRAHALVVRSDGYGYARLEENGWQVITHGSPLAFRPWPADIVAHIEASDFEGEQLARFDAVGSSTPARIVFDGAGVRWAVEIDSQGKAHATQIE